MVGHCYFSAVAYAGRLHIGGILDRRPWDPQALIYWTEAQVDAILNTPGLGIAGADP